ncbi:hypothetical protein [Citricoccus muralis]|uniref:Secreted protein n=1 Tax=Citricoccus muralis TaxID=169134 RepID=A0ABY8H8W6_9MICC|nr:hypothetical protein [Citricoccus muralis]WFP17589.1 hypothetical protein P8192_05665 [Citricoccus muralis]
MPDPFDATSRLVSFPTRRTVLTGLTGVGATWVLAACGSGGSNASESPSASGSASASVSAAASPSPTSIPKPELPGGGTRLFPGRRFVALYGSPGIPSLGLLGEQDLEESITRAQELAASYEGTSREPVMPAFEIISTVATASEGPTGEYTSAVDMDVLREWVEAAAENDIYVILDLQPGLSDFLTQAKHFEDLLLEPHVGLALDPEWRLQPGQRHMAQIGQVQADEVNATTEWLAKLVAENNLPEKLVILHQFQLRMIVDREKVVERPGLALLVHADGHGTPGQKMDTYRTLTKDLAPHVRIGWKNFIDEDNPTFTPSETMDIVPKPWFVSYQ